MELRRQAHSACRLQLTSSHHVYEFNTGMASVAAASRRRRLT